MKGTVVGRVVVSRLLPRLYRFLVLCVCLSLLLAVLRSDTPRNCRPLRLLVVHATHTATPPHTRAHTHTPTHTAAATTATEEETQGRWFVWGNTASATRPVSRLLRSDCSQGERVWQLVTVLAHHMQHAVRVLMVGGDGVTAQEGRQQEEMGPLDAVILFHPGLVVEDEQPGTTSVVDHMLTILQAVTEGGARDEESRPVIVSVVHDDVAEVAKRVQELEGALGASRSQQRQEITARVSQQQSKLLQVADLMVVLHGGLRSLSLPKHEAPVPPIVATTSPSTSSTSNSQEPAIGLDSWTPLLPSSWLYQKSRSFKQLRFPMPMSRFLSPLDETPYRSRNAVALLVDGHDPLHILSVRWFLRKVYPEFQSLQPSSQLIIAGDLPQDDLSGKNFRWVDGTPYENVPSTKSNINEIGQVDNFDDLLSHVRVVVSPLLAPTFFAGTLLAYQHALPLLVSRSVGESLQIHQTNTFGTVLLDPEDPSTFAVELAKVFGTESLWATLRQQSFERRASFTEKLFYAEVEDIVQEIASRRGTCNWSS